MITTALSLENRRFRPRVDVKEATAVFLPLIIFYIGNIAMYSSELRGAVPARMASFLNRQIGSPFSPPAMDDQLPPRKEILSYDRSA